VGISFIEYSRGNYNTVIAQLSSYVEEYRGFKSFGDGGGKSMCRQAFSAGDNKLRRTLTEPDTT